MDPANPKENPMTDAFLADLVYAFARDALIAAGEACDARDAHARRIYVAARDAYSAGGTAAADKATYDATGVFTDASATYDAAAATYDAARASTARFHAAARVDFDAACAARDAVRDAMGPDRWTAYMAAAARVDAAMVGIYGPRPETP